MDASHGLPVVVVLQFYADASVRESEVGWGAYLERFLLVRLPSLLEVCFRCETLEVLAVQLDLHAILGPHIVMHASSLC